MIVGARPLNILEPRKLQNLVLFSVFLSSFACGSSQSATDAPGEIQIDSASDQSALDLPTEDRVLDGPDATSDAPAEDTRLDVALGDVSRTDAPVSGWTVNAPLPFARQEISVAALGTRIYVVGGFESGAITATVRVYEPASDRWSEGPALPSARHHLALVALGDDLYALGGMLGFDFRPDATCYVLRAGERAWREISRLPSARGASVAGAIDGTIYLAGGQGPGGALIASTLAYDPRLDSWRERAPLPTPREHLAGFVYNSRLWTVGGRRLSLSSNLATVEVYDPSTDRWSPAASMPTPRGGLSATVLGDEAFAVGGERPERALNEVEALDLRTGVWRMAPMIPTPRHGHGAASVMGRVYVIGGADRPIFAAVRAVESFAP